MKDRAAAGAPAGPNAADPGKLLLLADIPPCENYTGGLVLAEQCRLLGPGSLAAFIVLNPVLAPVVSPDLSGIPMRIVDKPGEEGEWAEGLAAAVAAERHKATVVRDALVAQAVAFAREQGVTAVWAMLEGQTIVRMALPVAEALGVPLYTQVWDPLSWWLRAHGVDPENAAAALAQFDATLRASKACAAASWTMADEYRQRYGIRALPLISGFESEAARRPPPRLHRQDEIVIGMAGQLYADDAWEALIQDLDDADWRIGDRAVRIYYLGAHLVTSPRHCTRGGFLPPRAAIDALARNADILYCPYPFREEMAEVARLSFPSKLVMYAAAGRPILCHAPADSSPATYLDRTGAGAVCSRMEPGAIRDMLRGIAADPDLFARLAEAAQDSFRADFTRDGMARTVADFLS